MADDEPIRPEHDFTLRIIQGHLLHYGGSTKRANALAGMLYYSIRREMAKELLHIVDGGGDAYTRLRVITEKLEKE